MHPETILPGTLSSAQRRLWFLAQMESGDPSLFVQARVSFSGPLDIDRLRRCLAPTFERHTIVRSTFPMVQGAPIAAVSGAIVPELTVLDLPDGESESALLDAELQARRSLRLDAGPLVQATLVRFSETSHVLLLCLHRIIADRASIERLIGEIADLYAAGSEGTPEHSSVPESQYHLHTAAEVRRVETGEMSSRLDRIASLLGEAREPLQLATDRPRAPFQTSRIKSLSQTLSPDLWRALSALTADLEIRPEIALLAAFRVVLARCSGQSDFCIGWADATRLSSAGIGPYEDILPLRLDASGAPSFVAFLRQVSASVETAQSSSVPFELLMERLQPERATSYHPLCQARFVVHGPLVSGFAIGNSVSIERIAVSEPTKFDLTLVARTSRDAGNVSLDYNADLFDRGTAQLLLRRLEAWLTDAIQTPEKSIDALTVLDAAEREQLLIGWNRTERDVPVGVSLAEQVEAQVDRGPDEIAALFGFESMTYGALDRYANQVARHLVSLGIVPGDRVGICLPRGFDMLATVLGVLKSGGAYVPLDPAYPTERLELMLTDSAPSVVVTHSTLSTALPGGHSAVPVVIDRDRERIAQLDDSRLSIDGDDDRLMYITYTSGSTGKPKGIEMTQRPVRSLIEWMVRTTQLPARQRTLQFASLSFDVSFQDIFSTLTSGGTLVLISEDQRKDITGLWSVIVEQGVHRILLPAVALQQLAEGFRPEAHSASVLLKVISGSEQLLVTPAIQRMYRTLPDCRLHNEYGPSETHVVTECGLPASVDLWPQRPPIGRPIDNSTMYILDRTGDLAPIGVPGELYIGGKCLARGYRNRPEATAERFLVDNFANMAGARMYRTGDRARYLADGTLEFLGRLDHQVKVRGYRVEPAEIEGMLERHPSVREAAVVALECGTPNAYLAAYLAVEGVPAPTVSDLRMFLAGRLPDYLVPSAFVLMERLPLNANGKVDRAALPAPDQGRAELGSKYAPPTNSFERSLAAIWSRVLGVETIGMDDSFFDLGGHSMRLVQVQVQLREVLHRDVTVVDLFRHFTIRTLAQFLSVDKRQELDVSDAQERAQRQRQALARRGPALARRP